MNRFLKIIGFTILFLNFSCCAKKGAKRDLEILKTTSFKNGKEEIKLFSNKQLQVFSRNGSMTCDLQESDASDVIWFNYEEDMDKAVYDGGYREELFFEIPKGDFELSLSGTEFQMAKMIFGRHCFCRGQNGLFAIEDGKLEISRKKDKIKINLNFYQSKVPQKISRIQLN